VKRVVIPYIPGRLDVIHVNTNILHTESSNSVYKFETFINLDNNRLVGRTTCPLNADRKKLHLSGKKSKTAVRFFRAQVLDTILDCYLPFCFFSS
jgi:hypothetical protein